MTAWSMPAQLLTNVLGSNWKREGHSPSVHIAFEGNINGGASTVPEDIDAEDRAAEEGHRPQFKALTGTVGYGKTARSRRRSSGEEAEMNGMMPSRHASSRRKKGASAEREQDAYGVLGNSNAYPDCVAAGPWGADGAARGAQHGC